MCVMFVMYMDVSVCFTYVEDQTELFVLYMTLLVTRCFPEPGAQVAASQLQYSS